MDIQKLSLMLEEEEASRGEPYDDLTGKSIRKILDEAGIKIGHITIGIGRNLEDNPLSDTERKFLNGNDIAKASLLLDKNIPWWQNLDDVRQRVLCDMCFNMGFGDGTHGLSTFPNTLEHIRNGEYVEAAKHMRDSKWYNQVGRRGKRLALMMETGLDQPY